MELKDKKIDSLNKKMQMGDKLQRPENLRSENLRSQKKEAQISKIQNNYRLALKKKCWQSVWNQPS